MLAAERQPLVCELPGDPADASFQYNGQCVYRASDGVLLYPDYITDCPSVSRLQTPLMTASGRSILRHVADAGVQTRSHSSWSLEGRVGDQIASVQAS